MSVLVSMEKLANGYGWERIPDWEFPAEEFEDGRVRHHLIPVFEEAA
jgi:hypothetical protein